MQSLPIIAWCLAHLNYGTIAALMAVESSFIPFPSEIVIPPAAYLAAAGGGMNVCLIVIFGTLGALIGATVNYLLALWLGRPIIYAFANSRIGHMCLIDQEKVQKAEDYFVDHGTLATLVGRLVPAVRQLISLPAGLARMNFARFIGLTAVGALVWNAILAAIGYALESIVPYDALEPTVEHYAVYLKLPMIALGCLAVAYLVWQGMRKR